MTTTATATFKPRPLRYFAINLGERDEYEIPAYPASYNVSLGDKLALSYAKQNAKLWHGKVIVEYSDGSYDVVKDYSRKEREET